MSVILGWFFVLAVALGLGALEWSASPHDVPLTLATDIAAGWAFCVAGVLAWGGRRPPLISLLLEATGFAWLLGAVVPPLLDLYRGPLVHLLLCYPTGRVHGRLSRLTVVAAYASGVFGRLLPLQSMAPALLLIVAIVAIRTALGATGARARGRATAAVGATGVAAAAGVLTVGTWVGGLDPDTGRWVYAVVLGATGVILGADLRWGGWASEAVARVVIELGDRDEPATLRDLVANALGDPSLVIGYAAGTAGEYVDETGRRIEVRERSPGRSVTALEVAGQEVGILIRDGRAETDEALVEGVAAAAELALANVRLQDQAQRRIRQLASSRLRLIEAADAERLRIQQELDIEVGQRLTKAEAMLFELAKDVDRSDDSQQLLDEIRRVRGDLAQFSLGIGMGSLVADGLGPAIADLARGSTTAIQLDIPADRWPTLIETTAYFVCAEGLTNAAKHAGASLISVRVSPQPGRLELEILDDGRGGADMAGGSGLRGLADRVDTIGGSLTVQDGVTGGTRLLAVLPVSRPVGPLREPS